MSADFSQDFAGSIARKDWEAMVECLIEGLVTVDDQGRIASINRAACEIFEVPKDKAIEADCAVLLAEQFGRSTVGIGVAIRRHRPVEDVQIDVQTRFGRQKILVFRTALFQVARRQSCGTVVLVRDVTEKHLLQSDLACRDPLDGSGMDDGRVRQNRGASDQQTRGVLRGEYGTDENPGGAGPERELHPRVVAHALEQANWNVARAARRLGVSLTTLYKRIRQLKLQRPQR